MLILTPSLIHCITLKLKGNTETQIISIYPVLTSKMYMYTGFTCDTRRPRVLLNVLFKIHYAPITF